MSVRADDPLELLKAVLTASIYEESGWMSTAHARSGWRLWLNRLLSRHGLLLVRRQPFDAEARINGRDWPLFGYTMAGHKRLDHMQQCIATIESEGIAGDLIETGAWRGGMTIFMRALLRAHGDTTRRVWVADSFEGLPVPSSKSDGWDYSTVDILKVPLAQVKANFARFGLLDDQVCFLPGWFAQSLPGAPIERLSMLRLDGDLYSSTRDALDNLYAKLSPGGYVVVDDYYSWPACRRAVDDFRQHHGIVAPVEAIDWSACFWRVPTAHDSRGASA